MEPGCPPSSAPFIPRAPTDYVAVGAQSEPAVTHTHLFRVWLSGLIATLAACALSFAWLDVPVARHFGGNIDHYGMVAAGLSGIVLLSVELAVVTALVALRLVRGRLSPLGKAVIVASLASMCAYGLNEAVLKLVFGVPSPSQMLLQGTAHAIHFLSGNTQDGFPSGHMILAGAFAGAFIRFYPRATPGLFALLGLGAIALVWGDWHFVSDVIAGTFVGISVGLCIAHPRAVEAASAAFQRTGLLRRSRI